MTLPMDKKLMEEFPPTDPAEWRALVDSQLKGAAFDKKLVTQTPEGIAVQPIYTRESVQPLASHPGMPGEFPFLRGVSAAGAQTGGWEVGQEIPVATPEAFNEALRSDLFKGQTAVVLKLDRAGRKGQDAGSADDADLGVDGTSISNLQDVEVALNEVDLTAVPLYVQAGLAAPAFAGYLAASSHAKDDRLKKISGNLGMDILGQLASSGSLPADLESTYQDAGALAQWCRLECPGLRAMVVDVSVYGDAGAHAVQELAYMLATGADTMRKLMEQGLSPDDAAASIGVLMGIGPDFFTEISKFRAARVLWAGMINAFGVSEEGAGLDLRLTTLEWNKTVHDPYVNLLRTTTEAFSAGLGGCRVLTVKAFDSLSGEPDKFSRRIARNQQTVLAEEAHLTDVIDPAGGSWYVENLTGDLSKEAWGLFQTIEGLGGMGSALEQGKVQEWVAASASVRQASLARRKSVMVGTNMYANLDEASLPVRKADPTVLRARSGAAGSDVPDASDIHETIRSVASLVAGLQAAAKKGATLSQLCQLGGEASKGIQVEAIGQKRLTEAYESIRERTTSFAAAQRRVPAVFFANMGLAPQHKARSDFSAEFLKPSGFDILNNDRFETAGAAAKAVIASGAEVTVICSTDETYPNLVPAFAQKVKELNPKIMVLMAGWMPDHDAEFREAGVDDFIHLRANNLELLNSLLLKTGVPS